MHADEAVHAAKLGMLLEQGRYRYDPNEYHGPTLNYLTLVAARLRGAVRYQDLDEVTLRSVPAVAGVVTVAAHALLIPVAGLGAAAAAALLLAISPASVYYGRYYIQETLLVAFSFGALVSLSRYRRAPRMGWAIASGVCAGLMFATKETWIIALAAMVISLLLAGGRRWRPGHLLAAVLAAALIAALFFSSFLTHPRGIADAVTAYGTYVERAAGTASWHVHPWHYYLGLLLYFQWDGGPVWTEGAILAFALAGLTLAARARPASAADSGFLTFVACYTVLMIVAYAAIPYKTPWCLLGFLHGLILLAGAGVARLYAAATTRAARIAAVAIAAAAGAHLGWQAWGGSFRYAADPRNPYVYAHTGPGVFEIARRVEDLAAVHPQRHSMPIEVVTRENLWPLPWYLRRFSDVRWETAPAEDTAAAPVILATPDMEGAVAHKLYEVRPPGQRELYVSIFDAPVDLRPQVEVRGYAAKTLWDAGRQRNGP